MHYSLIQGGMGSASPLKQQKAGKHVAPLGHNLLSPSQPVFLLTPKCYIYRGQAANTNCIAVDLIHLVLKAMIYSPLVEYAITYTDVVLNAVINYVRPVA